MAEIAKTQANAALDAFIEAVTKALKKEKKLDFSRIWYFCFLVCSWDGRNPQTGVRSKLK
jgi:DNA-binding protein HU-beta